mmetsp:Transcript_3578/g.6259  ORF Transcript_3578/g.6259 Transcript_3578/m.6259 type:complete len:330 (-) Transcript_3578:2665-3654(-)
MGLVKVVGREWELDRELDTSDDVNGVYFVVIADPQLGMMQSNASWNEELELCSKAVSVLNTLRPAFVIVVGDLIHAHQQLYPDFPNIVQVAQQQNNDFIQTFRALNENIPLLTLCGNHDVGNIPTHESMNQWKTQYGSDYYSFFTPINSTSKVLCIVLNSQLLQTEILSREDSIKQINWLENTLEKHSEHSEYVFIFQHIAPFLYTPNEPDNLPSFSEFRGFQIPDSYFHLDEIPRNLLLKTIEKYDVKAIFCGHWHQNNKPAPNSDLELSEELRIKVPEIIITSSLGAQLTTEIQPGFRVVHLQNHNAFRHKYFSLHDTPQISSWLRI